jgi:hypothetical protein
MPYELAVRYLTATFFFLRNEISLLLPKPQRSHKMQVASLSGVLKLSYWG